MISSFIIYCSFLHHDTNFTTSNKTFPCERHWKCVRSGSHEYILPAHWLTKSATPRLYEPMIAHGGGAVVAIGPKEKVGGAYIDVIQISHLWHVKVEVLGTVVNWKSDM